MKARSPVKDRLKVVFTGHGRIVFLTVVVLVLIFGFLYHVWSDHKKITGSVKIPPVIDADKKETVGSKVTPEYQAHLQQIDAKKLKESMQKNQAFVANPLSVDGNFDPFSKDQCNPTNVGGAYMDSNGKILVAKVGGTGALYDAKGNPIVGKNGVQVVVPKGYYALVKPSGNPVLGPDGKPIIVSDRYRATLGTDGKPMLDRNGKPILVAKGSRLALGKDGKPLFDKNGKPIIVPKGYHVALDANGNPLFDKNGNPIIVPDGFHPVFGQNGELLLDKDGKPVVERDGEVSQEGSDTVKGGDWTSKINAFQAHKVDRRAMTEDQIKAQQAIFEAKKKAMMAEMSAINDSLFPEKFVSPPLVNYVEKKKPKSKKKNGQSNTNPLRKAGNQPKAVNIPDYIQALLKPGRVYYGKIDSKVNSDVPGPVLASVESGKLTGARLLGGFTKAHDYVVIKFSSITMPNGDVYPLEAYAVDAKNMEDGLAGNVDHHYLSRYGALLAGSFLYGFGQAEMYAGGAGTVTQFGTPVFVPNTSTLISQSMMGLGTAGQMVSNLTSQGFNRPSTVTVPKGQAVGILIIRAGAAKKSGIPAKQGQPVAVSAPQPTQPQPPPMTGYSPMMTGSPNGMMGGGMNGMGGGMPMMPMMP